MMFEYTYDKSHALFYGFIHIISLTGFINVIKNI